MHIDKVSVNNLTPYLDKYEHFSFDLWLTIIKSNPLFKQKRDELLKDYFAIQKDISVVNKTMRYYDILSNKISEKTGKHIDRLQIYLMVLNALDIDIMSISETSFKDFYAQVDALFLAYKPVLIDDSIPLLFERFYAENKTINILSNTAFIHGSILRQVLNSYNLSPYLTFQLYSDEVGFSKPNAAFFDLVFENINKLKLTSKDKILHIGDNENADVKGANNAGLDSILIKY